MDHTRRFSDRVENYVKYRPGYPRQIVALMEQAMGLTSSHAIADIGAGTGKLTELLLQHGYEVDAVEPNDPMREAAESLLGHYPGFRSIRGTAEASSLPDQCYDFIVAAQAFHWFDPSLARQEFRRILKPGGWVLLVWNERDLRSPFLQDYEQFLHDYADNYQYVVHRNMDEAQLQDFFHPHACAKASYNYEQTFDRRGLRGRYLSCSYAHAEQDPQYNTALEQLDRLFDQHQKDGRVRMLYQTNVYYGQWL